MKAGREHRVPLSGTALAILKEMQAHRHADNAFVFPGAKPGRPLSNMVFLMLLRRMGHGDVTTHGFRSSFRDWAAERTKFPAEVAEMGLAHTVAEAFPVLALRVYYMPYRYRNPSSAFAEEHASYDARRKEASALVERGARLRDVAAVMGIPMALRRIKPGAAHLII